jgi:cofilin
MNEHNKLHNKKEQTQMLNMRDVSSGVSINSQVLEVCNTLKKDCKFRYLVLALSERLDEVVVVSIGQRDKTWEDFIAQLPSNECRFGLFDLEYMDSTRNIRLGKLVFVLWAPELCFVKYKTVYASSLIIIRRKVSWDLEVQASEAADLLLEEVLCRVSPNALPAIDKVATQFRNNLMKSRCQPEVIFWFSE